jgi:hypothetical protein
VNGRLGDLRWNIRENRRLRAEGALPRICLLKGCDRELTANQRKFCSAGHSAADRQRRARDRKRAAAVPSPASWGEALSQKTPARGGAQFAGVNDVLFHTLEMSTGFSIACALARDAYTARGVCN